MAMRQIGNSFIGCTVLFFAIFLGLYGIYKWAEPYMQYYFDWLAATVSAAAGLFDPRVHHEGNVIYYDGTPSLRVVEGCDGVTVFILIVAAVLSFPKPLKERVLGVLILVPVLFALNWLRLFVLADIRFYAPDLFRLFHVYLFQPVMIFATFACFLVWILYDARSKGAH